MSTQPFNGVHLKIMCKDETQYKEILKILVKMGSDVSWTAPQIDDQTGEIYGFANFFGSPKYIPKYSI